MLFVPTYIRGLILILLLVAAFLGGNDIGISRNATGRLFDQVSQTPVLPVALVLGTSKYVAGSLNPYYAYRIVAAADLFHGGKVRGILVSGDNATRNYNEPTTMKKDLINLGVPESYITQDYAGFRTLDSVYRAQKIFGVKYVIIVSQRFHCQRALYIADSIGLNAIGYCAQEASYSESYMVRGREILARALAFVDVNVINKQPKYLGKREFLNLRNSS